MIDIKTIGVVGAGQMGNGIAHVFAQAGFSVRGKLHFVLLVLQDHPERIADALFVVDDKDGLHRANEKIIPRGTS